MSQDFRVTFELHCKRYTFHVVAASEPSALIRAENILNSITGKCIGDCTALEIEPKRI